MSLRTVLEGGRPGPYKNHPTIQINVLKMADQSRVLTWDFQENTAVPKIMKNNKVAVITDREKVTKITLFEEFSSKLK